MMELHATPEKSVTCLARAATDANSASFLQSWSATRYRPTGRAWGYRIHITIGVGSSWAEIQELLLHEIVHCISYGHHHDKEFKSDLAEAARKCFGVHVKKHIKCKHRYDIDREIEKKIAAKPNYVNILKSWRGLHKLGAILG